MKITNMTKKQKTQDKSKMCEIDDQILRMFEFKKRLGKGAYGIVWKAIDKRTNATVAVKKIFDAFRDQTDAQRTFREITFLNAFRSHPNVVMLHNVFKASNNLDIYLVFEYMETDLHNLIKRGEVLKEVHKRYIMYQLINAVKYIHSGNVIHRDLKPSNILVDSKCRCKLADFGLARSVSDKVTDDPVSVPMLTDYVATRWYRAPEILVASKNYTKGIDMWSLGCILGEMLLGKPLFQGSSTVNQIERIVMTMPDITEQDLKSVGTAFGAALLNKQISSERSISIKELLGDVPEDALDLVNKLLVLDPYQRLTAQQALEHQFVEKYRNTVSETNAEGNVLPPINDDIRLTVHEYRNKLYETVSEVMGPTTKKHIISHKNQRLSGNRSAILAYDKTPQVMKSRLTIEKSQINQLFTRHQSQTHKEIKMKHSVNDSVTTKMHSPVICRNVAPKTFIANLSSKVNVMKKDSTATNKETTPQAPKSNKSMIKSTINQQTPKKEPANDVAVKKLFSPEVQVKPRNFTSYPSTGNNHKILTGQHQKYHSTNTVYDRKTADTTPLEGHKDHMKLQSNAKYIENTTVKSLKTSELCSLANQPVNSEKNHNARMSTGGSSGMETAKQKCNRSMLPLIVTKNVANEKHNVDVVKETSVQQSKDADITVIGKNDIEDKRSTVSKMLANEVNTRKCICYGERLRQIELEIKSYESEVKSFAYDAMLLQQKRLKSAESAKELREPLLRKPKFLSAEAESEQHGVESKNALAGRVSFAGSSFGQVVSNRQHRSYRNSETKVDSSQSGGKILPASASISSHSTIKAKSPLLKIIRTFTRKLSNIEMGTGGSGDHISSKMDHRHAEPQPHRKVHDDDQRHKYKPTNLLRTHLKSPAQRFHNPSLTNINVQEMVYSMSNLQKNLKYSDYYDNGCKRKPTKAF